MFLSEQSFKPRRPFSLKKKQKKRSDNGHMRWYLFQPYVHVALLLTYESRDPGKHPKQHPTELHSVIK